MALAREEGEKRIADGAGINWDMVSHNATRMREHGFLTTIVQDQTKLRVDRSVLDETTARAFAHDQEELDRLESMAAGAPQLVGKNFQPNWGVGVRERIGKGPDVGPALQIHIADASRRGHVVIVPFVLIFPYGSVSFFGFSL